MTGLAIQAVSSASAARTSHDDPSPQSSLTGTRRLLWLVLRRDRFRIAMWMSGLVGLMGVSVWSVVALYTTQEDLEGYARTVRGNSAMIIQAGPGYGLDDPVIGLVGNEPVDIVNGKSIAFKGPRGKLGKGANGDLENLLAVHAYFMQVFRKTAGSNLLA